MLKLYESYKETNIPWLEKVPSHWELLRNKNVLFEQKALVGDYASDYTLLSLTLNGVVARDMESGKGKFPKEFNAYKIVKTHNIIFCLFDVDETPRTVGLSRLDGMITGAYDVFEVKNINRDFVYYYYLAVDNAKNMKPLYTGLRKVIGVPKFLGTKLPVPPQSEQDQIVRYLDWQTAKITKLINAKKKQIELLKEQKQAIINKAVTKGLDDTVPMKDSGIEWLGEVPEHYSICKLKNLGVFKSGLNLTAFDISDTGIYSVYGGNGLRGYFNKFTHSGEYLLIGRQGALCGNVHFVRGDFWATEHAITVQPALVSNIKWLYYLVLVMNLNQYSTAAAQPGISVEKIIALYTIVPSLKEQQAIVTYIEEKTALIDKAVAVIEKEIELVSEYKISLISSIVTGRVDVRDEVVPEFEAVEGVAEGLENDEMDMEG